MGCFGSKSAETKTEKGRVLKRPVWASEYPMTKAELQVFVSESFWTPDQFWSDKLFTAAKTGGVLGYSSTLWW